MQRLRVASVAQITWRKYQELIFCPGSLYQYTRKRETLS